MVAALGVDLPVLKEKRVVVEVELAEDPLVATLGWDESSSHLLDGVTIDSIVGAY